CYMGLCKSQQYFLDENFKKTKYAKFIVKNEVDFNDLIYSPETKDSWASYIDIPYLIENNKYMYITARLGLSQDTQDLYRFLYNKQTRTVIKTSGFEDNINGGPTLWPSFSANNSLVCQFESFELLNHVEKSNVQLSSKLSVLMDSLDINSNPIFALLK
ncbi:MAG: hypothetical protein PF444_06165, partial [Bacteroidales bacterium]|nr:hypothetical protein [Bacteroidales bacterium]